MSKPGLPYRRWASTAQSVRDAPEEVHPIRFLVASYSLPDPFLVQWRVQLPRITNRKIILTKKASEARATPKAWPWRGSVVKARRLALAMTQQDLSDASTVSVSCLSAYENDRATPRKQNQCLILDALGGTWPGMYDDSPASGVAPRGAAGIPGREEGCPDGRGRCFLGGELERIAASCDATVVVSTNGEAFASGRDNRLLVIRACVTPATLKDVMRLRALVDRLEEQVRGHAP